MRLTELNPRWVMRGAERVGFLFLCPHCKVTTLYCQIVAMKMSEQMRLIHQTFPDNKGDVIPAAPDCAWKITGAMTFDDMTVTPSINAERSGHWHGFIKNGAIT